LVRRGLGKHDGELCWQDLVLDPVHQSVQQAGQTLNLTAMEYRLLHLLMANHPHYLSRPKFEEKLYGWQQDIESNTLDVHLSHLRKKLRNVVIRNSRNLGWRLEA
jgi:two-component system, OmpR family, response regulator QseB